MSKQSFDDFLATVRSRGRPSLATKTRNRDAKHYDELIADAFLEIERARRTIRSLTLPEVERDDEVTNLLDGCGPRIRDAAIDLRSLLNDEQKKTFVQIIQAANQWTCLDEEWYRLKAEIEHTFLVQQMDEPPKGRSSADDEIAKPTRDSWIRDNFGQGRFKDAFENEFLPAFQQACTEHGWNYIGSRSRIRDIATGKK